MKFTLSKKAQKDLNGIYDFSIKQWGKEKAKDYILNLQHTIQYLANNPHIGKKQEKLGKGVCSFPCRSHMIYFLLDKNKLVVITILHQAMLPVISDEI